MTRSLYDRALRISNLPLLREHVPQKNSKLSAHKFMTHPVICLPSIADMTSIKKAI